MKAIAKFFSNIWRAIRQAAIDPVVDVCTVVAKGDKMSKKQKDVMRDILIIVGAAVMRFVPYMGWVSNILTALAVLNALMIIVDIIDALAKGDGEQEESAASVPTPDPA